MYANNYQLTRIVNNKALNSNKRTSTGRANLIALCSEKSSTLDKQSDHDHHF